jgi:hypothetical protein
MPVAVHLHPAKKSAGVSVSVSIPLAANPVEYALAHGVAGSAHADHSAGRGSNAAAWLAAAAAARIAPRLHGSPAAAARHQPGGVSCEIRDGAFVVSTVVAKRGASVAAVIATVLKEACRVSAGQFREAAKAAGNSAGAAGGDEHAAAAKAMRVGALSATIVLVGKIYHAVPAKQAEQTKKYVAVAKKGAARGLAGVTAGAGGALKSQAGGAAPGTAQLAAKGLAAFALCRFVEEQGVPAVIRGGHVVVSEGARAKLAKIGNDAGKKAAYAAKLKKGAPHGIPALAFCANACGCAPAGAALPAPAALAAAVFAALK